MPTPRRKLYELSRLISKLEKWVEKREARGLESSALVEALESLRDYRDILTAKREAAA